MLKRRNKKLNILDNKINLIINIMEKSNLRELTYILGNKKEIIIRNFLAGISRGVGIGIRNNCNYSYLNIYITKNRFIKYSYNW